MPSGATPPPRETPPALPTRPRWLDRFDPIGRPRIGPLEAAWPHAVPGGAGGRSRTGRRRIRWAGRAGQRPGVRGTGRGGGDVIAEGPQPATASAPLLGARRLVAAGNSVVAVPPDGSKHPATAWKTYQARRPTDAELVAWFGSGRNGPAVVTGAISGQREVVDVDRAALFAPYGDEVERRCPGLMGRVTVVRTPRPGYQLHYRCPAGVAGNQPLAREPKTPTDADPAPFATLIETRGEGGLALTPACPPDCHPTGRPYRLLQGDFAAPAAVSAAERRCSSRRPGPSTPTPRRGSSSGGGRPSRRSAAATGPATTSTPGRRGRSSSSPTAGAPCSPRATSPSGSARGRTGPGAPPPPTSGARTSSTPSAPTPPRSSPRPPTRSSPPTRCCSTGAISARQPGSSAGRGTAPRR